jgi:hypothetical protein
MEHDKIIFFRNFLGVFYFIITFAFWNVWASWVASFFKVDEKEFGRLMLVFFMSLRILLVFLFLVPALALHWMARKKQ